MNFSLFSSDVGRVSRWLDFAQAAYVFAMAGTVIFTLAIVILSKKQSSLKDAEFNRYKVTAEADTRERIAKVEADAKERIAKVEADAKTETRRVESESNVKIAEAKADAGRANEEAKKAVLEQERLKEQNLATEAKLEEERKTRVDLERAVAPRLLWIVHTGNKTNIDGLRPFAGTNVILKFLPNDSEAENAAGAIHGVLTEAGWKIISVIPSPELGEGVVITSERVHIPSDGGQLLRNDWGAVQALRELLEASEWEMVFTRTGTDTHDTPPNTITIEVGRHDTLYFGPPAIRDQTRKSMRKAREIVERSRQEQAERDRQFRELMEHDPRFKEMMERAKQPSPPEKK